MNRSSGRRQRKRMLQLGRQHESRLAHRRLQQSLAHLEFPLSLVTRAPEPAVRPTDQLTRPMHKSTQRPAQNAS